MENCFFVAATKPRGSTRCLHGQGFPNWEQRSSCWSGREANREGFLILKQVSFCHWAFPMKGQIVFPKAAGMPQVSMTTTMFSESPESTGLSSDFQSCALI